MTGNYELHAESLTSRERQIAGEFGISEETVKKHLATIYGKLALPGRVALAVHVLQTSGFNGGTQMTTGASL